MEASLLQTAIFANNSAFSQPLFCCRTLRMGSTRIGGYLTYAPSFVGAFPAQQGSDIEI